MNPRTVRDALVAATGRLAGAGIGDPGRDARILTAAALEISPDRLTLAMPDTISIETEKRLETMIDRRMRHQPVSQITGRRGFWGRDFRVTPDVLDPRPETETLIALALDGPKPDTILDLGTGTGAILLTLLAEFPSARGVGADVSPRALEVARANARDLGLEDRVNFVQSDWTSDITGTFDLIVCNPPYIPQAAIDSLMPDVRNWEPHLALTPGESGLEDYQAIAAQLEGVMSPRSRALFEFGEGQAPDVASIFKNAGFERVVIHRDMDERERVAEILLKF